MIALILAIAVAGFIFFFTRYIQLRSGYKSMSTVERHYAEVTATQEEKNAAGKSLKSRWQAMLMYYGLESSIFPAVAAVAFGYLVIASVLRAVGLSEVNAVLAALPVSVLIVVVGRKVAAGRRKDRFNSQMVTLLDLLIGQIRGGTGVERALAAVLPSLQEPLRGEIDHALKVAATGGDLLEALEQTKEKYPSRALDLFLAALEIDRSEGHSIVPALEQAADLMRNAFTLQSEGRAELGSAKWEFYGVFAVVMGLSFQMLFASQNAASVWANPLGVLILILAFANAIFGVWRFTRIVGKLKEETE